MKTLNESFTDQEWQQLTEAKAVLKPYAKNWHDVLLLLASYAHYVDFTEGRRGEADV